MRSIRILFFASLLAVTSSLASFAADRVNCYTTWDDSYLYLAFEVKDRDITGVNSSFMSKPWEDDCVQVFVETDAKGAANRTPNTFEMVVSAAGGSSWLIGNNGKATPKPIYSFKYAKKIQGTLNNPNDADLGYIVEMAFPWKEMGFTPTAGQILGFNVVCKTSGDTNIASFSPNVKTPADIEVPANWGKMKLSDSASIVAMEDGAVVCRKVVTRVPIVDGNLSQNEWMRDMSFQIQVPEAVQTASSTVNTTAPEQRFLVGKLALTVLRQPSINQPTTDHPMPGTDPAMFASRTQWYKDQLEQIRNLGIDVVLADGTDLDNISQALKDLKAEGRSYPLIGMLLQNNISFDMEPKSIRDMVYRKINTFFTCIPDEFRAIVQTPIEKGGYPAYIVVAQDVSGGLTDDKIVYCDKRFSDDFGGRKLIWIASSDDSRKSDLVAGYWNPDSRTGLRFNDSGWIKVAAISPGYDNTSIITPSTITPRIDGEAYKHDGEELAKKPADWVIVDSWNDFKRGTEVSASAEYGTRFQVLTKMNMLRFNGARKDDARYVRHDTPSVMLPGTIYQVNLTIANTGGRSWYPDEGVYVAGRWFKDGVLFADTGARLPLQDTVMPGQAVAKTVGVRTMDSDGKPLPEGNYELRWEMLRGRDEWFSNGGAAPLCVPVKIGRPAEGFTLVSSTFPTIVQSGSTYNVKIKIRNDGPDTIKAGTSKLRCRMDWTPVRGGTVGVYGIPYLTPNDWPIQEDLVPGRVVELAITAKVDSKEGKYAPTMNDLSWAVVPNAAPVESKREEITPSITNSKINVQTIELDINPNFILNDTPKEMEAGKKYTVNLEIENGGPDAWTKEGYAVGYRWYYLDGDKVTPLPVQTALIKDIAPGEKAIVKASVTPPAYDGQYFIEWSVIPTGDKLARTNVETQLLPVTVKKGKLTVVNLDTLYDSDVISYDMNRADGDADGSGMTFPAEFLPPFANGTIDADRLWSCAVSSDNHSDNIRNISFKFPSKEDGAKNAVSCKGQTIKVPSGKYKAMHILLISPKQEIAQMQILYKGKTAPAGIRSGGWYESHLGLVSTHMHTPSGDLPGKRSFVQMSSVGGLEADKDLTGIVLPNNPGIKILAITLEKN